MKEITGGIHKDRRGTLIHFNDFDMTTIKRFYAIEPADTQSVRAWQGHAKEAKWFYCYKGKVKLQIIAVSDWENPTSDLQKEAYILEADQAVVVHVPGGYVNGFQALEENSAIMVFSDSTLAESAADDFRFPLEKWNW